MAESKVTGPVPDDNIGVSAVAQWLMNPTSFHADLGSIPELTQWVEDLVLL